MKKLIFLSTFYLCSQFSYAQNPTFSVKEIDSIVKRIDSTCISGGITDYNFHKKGNKKKVIGGGADWFYTDTSSTKLLKAIRETSLNTENLDSYYFYQDSLIYLTISNRTYIDGKKVINWQGQYYFQNGRLIFKHDNLKFLFDPKTYFETARRFFKAGEIWRR